MKVSLRKMIMSKTSFHKRREQRKRFETFVAIGMWAGVFYLIGLKGLAVLFLGFFTCIIVVLLGIALIKRSK
jgi:uncharacterized membrane protein (DUF485 family)